MIELLLVGMYEYAKCSDVVTKRKPKTKITLAYFADVVLFLTSKLFVWTYIHKYLIFIQGGNDK